MSVSETLSRELRIQAAMHKVSLPEDIDAFVARAVQRLRLEEDDQVRQLRTRVECLEQTTDYYKRILARTIKRTESLLEVLKGRT